MKKIKYSLLLVIVSLLAVGCSQLSLHRVDVYQGNYIEVQRLENLKPGMSKADVQLLLGTPLVRDVYDPYTWYYTYYHSSSEGDVKALKTLRIHFDQSGQYLYYDGDGLEYSPGVIEEVVIEER